MAWGCGSGWRCSCLRWLLACLDGLRGLALFFWLDNGRYRLCIYLNLGFQSLEVAYRFLTMLLRNSVQHNPHIVIE